MSLNQPDACTPKRYACSRCGFEVVQETNHYEITWSVGRINTCPKCPPFAKYPEFGGQTIWNCVEPQTTEAASV